MKHSSRMVCSSTAAPVEMLPGIIRRTLTYNDTSMLCHITLQQGSIIPLHNHTAVQNGYVIRGSIRFLLKDGDEFTAERGSAYIFASDEFHGAEALEYSELLESFTPAREEYT